MPTDLLITVDTELSNFPDGQGLWGRVDGREWGLPRMLEVFRELGVRATFFLDVYAGNERDLAQQRRAAELIAKDGHDLQLHTHPGPAFDPKRARLRDYELAEQKEILEFGRGRIAEWTGVRATLHRAGDWGADHRSLRALLDTGFDADFSACAWSANCALDRAAISGNGWTWIDAMLCGVGTGYRDRITGRLRRVDLGGVSFAEVEDMLSRRIDPLILTLHSFSLVHYNRARTHFAPDPGYEEKLARFCRIARDAEGYRIVTAREAVTGLKDNPGAVLPWAALPTSRTAASCAGIVKSVRNRVLAYLE